MAQSAGVISTKLPTLTIKIIMPPLHGVRMWIVGRLIALAALVGPHDVAVVVGTEQQRIEHVARAMCVAAMYDPDEDDLGRPAWRRYEAPARTAIRADDGRDAKPHRGPESHQPQPS